MRTILQIENVSKTYQGPTGCLPAVAGLSLEVGAGELVVLQGPSGSGKTTLLLMAGGLLEPDHGTVTVDGQDLTRLPPEPRAQFRATRIGFVFQQFHLLPYLSVWENVLAPTLAAPSREAAAHARDLLARFKLNDRAQHVPAQLSTGERQRTALARALLNKPALVLADEPTGNLDTENALIVVRALREFAEMGGAVLLVTHDLALAQAAHRLLRLERGQLAPRREPCLDKT